MVEIRLSLLNGNQQKLYDVEKRQYFIPSLFTILNNVALQIMAHSIAIQKVDIGF